MTPGAVEQDVRAVTVATTRATSAPRPARVQRVAAELDHRASAGARDVVLVAGADANGWNQDTETAYRLWTAAAGLAPRVLHAPESVGVHGGHTVAARLLAEGPPDAAICATGRQSALDVEELTVRTLVATSSDSEHARISTPTISAIDMRPERLAAAAVGMLQALIHDEPAAERLFLPTTPILRESADRPRPV